MNFKRKLLLTCTLLFLLTASGYSQELKKDSVTIIKEEVKETPKEIPKETTKETPKKWYDQIAIRGYAQFRYNRFLETNDSLKNEQGDRSWGNGGISIRRMRIIFSGNVHERVAHSQSPLTNAFPISP